MIVIDDVFTALDLLCRRWGDNTTREIDRRFDEPFIKVGYHHDFVDSTYREFYVTKRLVEELISKGYVAGNTDMKILRITATGADALWQRQKM